VTETTMFFEVSVKQKSNIKPIHTRDVWILLKFDWYLDYNCSEFSKKSCNVVRDDVQYRYIFQVTNTLFL